MPAFIKTPADEVRWAKAKEAASKTLSESDGDSYWKLTNSIYQKMNKAEDLEKNIKKMLDFSKKSDSVGMMDDLKSFLEKARKRLVDEPDEDEDQDDNELGEGFREFDPDAEEDDASKWLAENDPEQQDNEETDEEPIDEDQDYGDYSPASAESLFDEGGRKQSKGSVLSPSA